MFSKVASTAAVALAAATLVSAQTFTKCNPLEKTCPADSAIGSSKVSCDLTSDLCSAFTEADATTLTYGDQGAVFTINKGTDAPTVQTGKFIFFGRLDVEVQAAEGDGIVTSAVLQSDDLDEIDWEWVGGDNKQAQSNYFSKGNTETYDRGAYHTVSSPLTTSHTYSVEWTSTKVEWIIDDVVVRTLTADNAEGGADGLPQTPMEIKLGTWVAGNKDTAKGTVEWAGGYTNFDDAPFNAYYKSISIVDYAGGDSPTSESIKEYIYGDKTGSYESIKVVKGDSDDTTSSAASTSTKATKTVVETTSTKAAATTTEVVESTATSATKKTTSAEESETASATSSFFTATTSGAPTTVTGTPSATTGTDAAATTTGAPAETTVPDSAATRGSIAMGGAALAAAAAVAQLL